jgi:hypothetical protein
MSRAYSSVRLERIADNDEVGGSSPPGPTKISDKGRFEWGAVLLHCSRGGEISDLQSVPEPVEYQRSSPSGS